MNEAYNFLFSWQLFPEKGIYSSGHRPKSGIYKLSKADKNILVVETNWVTLENQAFSSIYEIIADGETQVFSDSTIASSGKVIFKDSLSMCVALTLASGDELSLLHEIQPNGYLKLTEDRVDTQGISHQNISYYHKQMSVLPYSSSVSGAVIRPTEEGVIRHKSLTAMEEQTNMQLNQIRQQIELLALQAQEIQRRKELSVLIYSAKLNFTPVIGQTYFLYEKKDGSHVLSLVSPTEWGKSGPFKKTIATVRLLADHTWMEVNNEGGQ